MKGPGLLSTLKSTLMAAVAVIPPVALSIAAASYCLAAFHIGGTLYKAIESLCFFAILIAEACAYDKFQQWRLSGHPEPERGAKREGAGLDRAGRHDVRTGTQ
jgi:hypothetical protein